MSLGPSGFGRTWRNADLLTRGLGSLGGSAHSETEIRFIGSLGTLGSLMRGVDLILGSLGTDGLRFLHRGFAIPGIAKSRWRKRRRTRSVLTFSFEASALRKTGYKEQID